MSRANPRARGGSARRSQRQPTPMTVPVAPRTMWRLILTGFGGLGLAAAIIWAIVADLPQKTMLSVATSASSAGFVVRQVDISGASNQPRLDIYRQILYGGSDSMLLTDRGVEGAPTLMANLTDWDVSPSFGRNFFTFTPPKDARRIPFMNEMTATLTPTTNR